jgi:hypothetical protein
MIKPRCNDAGVCFLFVILEAVLAGVLTGKRILSAVLQGVHFLGCPQVRTPVETKFILFKPLSSTL